MQYLALLRGINVGGKNLIKMSELKACLEAMGLQEVRTYIQSGNVIFKTGRTDKGRLAKQIEDALSEAFGYELRIVLRSQADMERTVAEAPDGFGSEPALYRYDAVFLREPLTAAAAMRDLKIKEGVDQAFAGRGVLYFARLVSKLTQSRLTRLNTMPVYQSMTVRNWSTTVKLLELLRAAEKRESVD